MWVAKIKFSSKGTLIGSKAVEYKVDIFGFPLSYSIGKEWITVQVAGTIFGKPKNKRAFRDDLKKNKRVINAELNNDFLIGIIKEPLYAACLYNTNIIHVAPVFISAQGYEIITIAAFERKLLTRISELFEKQYDGELISIQNKKVKSISIMHIHPDLTEKQKAALQLAIKQGYYNSPRTIDLKHLAEIAKLSFSTYQVHLRKAEKKIIPYFFE